ncbi:enoyl-CoA hydratase-related protein [Brevibacillus brevis]|uniref:Enoyl-CoA hydratase-related protein n=1 Tax=Brevibacillus brevis TaxID=1393 RepID=A0ABY9SZ62_BREBE|nr:enoyl-CoA hydratase-related protein [Brevibacillus brevis]WNC12306.1 enoyl-CoA hydratase-related protein [Brevibacillus brevis]
MSSKNLAYTDLIVKKESGIGKIIINREAQRNAISPNTWKELEWAIDDFEDDPNIKVAIVTGAGNKSFAAGADLKAMQKRTAKDILSSNAPRVLMKMEQSRIVYIASINGVALGGGCEVALACDIRIASKNAKFGQPEVLLSLIPAGGGTQRLPRIIGESMAKDLIFTGRVIDGEEALRIGLISQLCEFEELEQETEKKAASILKNGPLAVEYAKTIMNSTITYDNRGYLLEKLYQGHLMNSEDTKEGISAFLEKRKPNFKGE